MQVLLSFVAVRNLTHIFFYRFFHGIRDGPDLGLVAGFADDEKVGNRFWYFAQVKRYNIFAFFILYSPDDGFVNSGGLGEPGWRFLACRQYV